MAEIVDILEEKQLSQEEQDRQAITRNYRRLLESIKANMDEEDKRNIRLAFELAVDAHKEQRRKSGEPYVLHPIEVARICAEEIGLGPTAVICALLHDVVEDTPVTLEDISKRFGERGAHIAKIVDGLTKLDHAYSATSKQAENFRKVLTTLVEDVRVVLIKMADRLHNMRTLGAMPRHKQLKIAAETSYIYAPLAHRLGLYSFKTEFEDLCMKITEPELYKDIARKLNETKRARVDYISRFLEPIQKALDEELFSYRITGRPKSIYSISNKIKKKDTPFEEIYDLFAIRIIVDVPPKKEKSVCWQVYSEVTDIYRPIPERLKDWVTTPKSNGYESLHTTVIGPDGRFVEVQIRSERMNEIAERGFAAHWKYKGVSSQPDVYDIWLNSVRDMLENPGEDAVEFLSDFKTNLFKDEVYVFTPKGDMRTLPKGATALDFAFSIHTDVGYRCTAIKVNNHIVPMGHELENGDRIEIITSAKQKPSEGWLKMVNTGRARSKIRSSMKEERRKQGELAREAFMRKCKNLKIEVEESTELLVKHFGYKSHVDLFFDIAMDKLTIPQIFKQFQEENGKLVPIVIEEKPKPEEVEVEVPKARRKHAGEGKLLINDEPGNLYDYSFASCCNPVPGDTIFGYLTTSAGLKIHRTTCPNATNLMANYGYRIMRTEWGGASESEFVANLIIKGIDDGPGVIQRLTNKISNQLKLNIRSLAIAGNQGYYEAKVSLLVPNTDQLYLAVEALKNLDHVSSVTREDS